MRFQVCYLDTNIFGILLDESKKKDNLEEFLYDNNFVLGISEAQIVELSEVPRGRELSLLISELPSQLIKTSHQLIDEEVGSYPGPREKTFQMASVPGLIEFDFIEPLLSSQEIRQARILQKRDAQQMWMKIQALKPNFLPTDSGIYERTQANDFSWMITCQWLVTTHPNFIRSLIKNGQILKVKSFKSLQLFGYVIFYKYYIQGRQSQQTDFGDMFHLFHIPYCKWAIIENDNCNVLNEIKANHNLLQEVTIRNISFLK